MDKIIIKNIDNSKFKDLQCALFEHNCYWKYSEQNYRTYELCSNEYICVEKNIISLITKNEIYKYYDEYIIFNNINSFLRNIKLKKIYE